MATHFTREQISTTPLVLAQFASVDPKQRIRKALGHNLKLRNSELGHNLKLRNSEEVALFESAVEAQAEIEALADSPFSKQRLRCMEFRNETLAILGKRKFFRFTTARKPKFESSLPEGHMASFPW